MKGLIKRQRLRYCHDLGCAETMKVDKGVLLAF